MSSHDRLASLLDSRFNDRFSLSTKRLWNLFRLPWLPLPLLAAFADEAPAFGGLHPELLLLVIGMPARVGLVTREFCEAREEVRVMARFCMRCAKAAMPEGLP